MRKHIEVRQSINSLPAKFILQVDSLFLIVIGPMNAKIAILFLIEAQLLLYELD